MMMIHDRFIFLGFKNILTLFFIFAAAVVVVVVVVSTMNTLKINDNFSPFQYEEEKDQNLFFLFIQRPSA